jgi:hypothetical protein
MPRSRKLLVASKLAAVEWFDGGFAEFLNQNLLARPGPAQETPRLSHFKGKQPGEPLAGYFG